MAARSLEPAVLGEVLRSIREAAGLSQEELADRAGLHRTYIGGIERGERNPTFVSVAKILAVTGSSWTKLGRALDHRLR